jgi:hypothetical protein
MANAHRPSSIALVFYLKNLAPLGWYDTAILARWLIGRMSVGAGTRGARFVR